MTGNENDMQMAWWTKNIDELDREIGRLCAICEVRILDPGIIERVLKKDASVCGKPNSIAFERLHNMLMFYYVNREKAVDAVGEVETEQIEAHVVEALRKRFSDLLGKWPPLA